MDWFERLNVPGENALFADAVSVLHWAYAPQLSSNVPHRHTYFEICLAGSRGSGVFSVGTQTHRLAEGDLFVARPGVIHQIQTGAPHGLELFWVAFDVRLDSLSEEIEETPALWRAFLASSTLVARDDGSLLALWNALRAVAQAPEVLGKARQLHVLREALLLAIAQSVTGAQMPGVPVPANDCHGMARLATRYIHDNLMRRISVEEVASHVHLSPRQLQRLFRDFAGVSVAAYLETARLDRARLLLQDTQRPIKEIARGLGYQDVHYFTRVFSKRHGLAPGQFRRDQSGAPRHIRRPGEGELV